MVALETLEKQQNRIIIITCVAKADGFISERLRPSPLPIRFGIIVDISHVNRHQSRTTGSNDRIREIHQQRSREEPTAVGCCPQRIPFVD
jgi:hypothetical protein